MKLPQKLRPALFSAALLLFVFGTANADNNPLIAVNENGTGSLLFPGGPPIPTVGVLQADPGPGGLGSALTYNLLGPPGLVSGDVFVRELGTNILSDIIRFNPAGTGNPGYPASLVFYSLPGEGALADTGFPTANYTRTFTVFEVNGIATFTPNDAQPGFVPGFSVTYTIDSRTPEPVSLVLLGTGLSGLALKRFRKRKVA